MTVRRQPVRFGLIRTLIWLCPGFGGAAVFAGLSHFIGRRPSSRLGEDMIEWASLGACIAFIAVFGWLDALANPGVEKRDGHPGFTELGRWIALFSFGQLIAAPVLFCFTVVVLDVMGIRL